MALFLISTFLLQTSMPVMAAGTELSSIKEQANGGKIPSKVQIEYVAGEGSEENLPSKMIPKTAAADLKEYTAETTSVKDQNPLGTCWSFATYGNLESFLKKKTGVEYDFSENHMKYSMTASDATYDNPYGYDLEANDGGNYFMSLAYLTRDGDLTGPVLEENDQYDGGSIRSLSKTRAKEKTDYYVTQVKMLGDLNYTGNSEEWWKKTKYLNYIDDVKSMIYNYGAIYSGYYSTDVDAANYHEFDYGNGITGIAYLSNLREIGGNTPLIYRSNHAITIVGWDDNFSKEKFYEGCQPDSDGAFLVKNSWGEDWGQNGYFWMSYEEFLSESCAVMKVDTRSNLYDHLYEYDLLGVTDTLNVSGKNLVYMNRFSRKTSKKQKVTAVSSYFLDKGVKVNVYVSPTRDASKLKKVAETSIKNTGFHVISLDAPVTITDSKYLVAIEIVSDTSGITVPVEDQWTFYGATSQAKASSGQGYIGTSISSVKAGKYTDLTKMKSYVGIDEYDEEESIDDNGYKHLTNANLCLKAYTKNTGTTLTSINKASVTNYYKKTYTGSNTSQSPVVKLNGKTLRKGTDYRIVYSNHKNPGIATMTIVGNGNYCGSVVRTYKICPKTPKISSISSTSKGKIKLKWNRPYKATGFEVYIKCAGTSKYVKVKTTTSTSMTLTGLKSGKKYYVKVRAYTKSGSQKIYSSLSGYRSKIVK